METTTEFKSQHMYKNMAQPLKPCGLYLYTGGLKTGCHLHGDFLNVTNLTTEVFFLINRTHGLSILQNKFKRTPRDNSNQRPMSLGRPERTVIKQQYSIHAFPRTRTIKAATV
ncbi:hypothetical protein JZ751_006944 [Albula glossodonta]|uniref:Uncharacterized protein n=1 Tax=Albula glossodonta TaxID=121402 RepID=A0A8T2NZT6_9TELE|nr:hypothetical protein JZ751_006944 [Albula glossodonta]